MEEPKTGQTLTFAKSGLMPQEEVLEVSKDKKKLTISVIKESLKHENRVALAPHAIELLASDGHIVWVEKEAGINAHFTDLEYSEAGGEIIEDRKQLFSADIIIKVAPPNLEEISWMRGNQTLISSLMLSSCEYEYITALQDKRITAVAFEFLKDNTNRVYPVTESMSEISGSTAILIAAEYLSNANLGKGEMLGGIAGVSPTDVVVLGAATAGEYAVRTALGLGATVKVFDTSIERLRKLQHKIGQRFFTSIIQPRVVNKALKTADVVIGALPFEDHPRFMVSIDSVMQMKAYSVIVDIAIDYGGCFETSEPTTLDSPIFRKFNIVHYCVPNIPSRVSRTASYALSNIFGPLLLDIADAGGVEKIIVENPGFRHGVYIFNGILTKESIGRRLGLPSRDIDLLMAAF
ncbi:MAG TPA: alanine dehydrogenase [Salinivirgaceae bacterium]|nr:alanine dehydrogenase [Salinivirgaceae bacterium]